MTMNYFKTILEKVSFDKKLFNKELAKAAQQLKDHEYQELKNWCLEKFDENNENSLEHYFKPERKASN